MNAKKRSIAVLEGREADRTPVFPLLMGFTARQSGHTYRQFAQNGTILAESQVRITEKYPVDVITACSDAFRLSADLGGEIVFPEEKPPHLNRPLIERREDLDKLGIPDMTGAKSRCADRVKAVREMARAVGETHFVLGWVDFPFAEACSACGVANFMYMLVDEPQLAHDILAFLAEAVTHFALLQLEAGAPMIGAGDAAASLVSPQMFAEYALPYERRVVEAIHRKGGLVKTHICGDTRKLMPLIAQNGSDLYNVDHMVSLDEAIRIYGGQGKAVKGNIDPVEAILRARPKQVYASARECINKASAAGAKYFLSPGCEIPPETGEENFRAFCEAAL